MIAQRSFLAAGRLIHWPPPQPYRRWLLVIAVLAVALRLSWTIGVRPDPRDGRLDDSTVHYSIARHLADGDGLIGLEGTPTAGPPGYPAMLAPIFLLPGDDLAAGRVLNVVLGLSLVLSAYYLGSRLWDKRAGLFAALAFALFPSNIYFTSLLMKEPVFASLMAGALCLLAWTLAHKPSALIGVLFGAFVAFISLVRPEGLALVPLVLVLWFIRYRPAVRAFGCAGLFIVGVATLYAPWTVRNAIQMHALVITPTGGGLVLIDTHDAGGGARAPTSLAASPSFRLAFNYGTGLSPEQREVRLNNHATRLALTYFVKHIPRELQLAPQRLAWFFRGDRDALLYLRPELGSETRERLGSLADVYYYALIGIAVLSLPFWVRKSRFEHLVLWGPIVMYVLMWAFVFPGMSRYHTPLLAILCVLAGIGISSIINNLWLGHEAA